MPDIDDDETLSEAELDIMDGVSSPGSRVLIDLSSAAEVERANRLLQRGLIRIAGPHADDGSPGLRILVARIEPGEAPAPFEPLVVRT